MTHSDGLFILNGICTWHPAYRAEDAGEGYKIIRQDGKEMIRGNYTDCRNWLIGRELVDRYEGRR